MKRTESLSRTFRAAKHGAFSQADIARVGPWLRGLIEKHGELSIGQIWELASKPGNPAHDVIFSVPAGEAAQRFYIDRLRALCRAVRVSYLDESGEERADAPLVVSVRREVTKKRGSGFHVTMQRRYVTFERAMNDPGMRRSMLDAALEEADRWRARHDKILELAPIFDAIDRVERRTRKRRTR